MSISEKWHGLDLSDDQLEMLNLVRDFCAKEVRPNGAQYHLSQKTPTAILKKAAQCDFYSSDFFLQLFSDPTGLTAALAIEEMFYSDAGIALALFGTGLPASAIVANGTPKQIEKWLPRCFGTAKDPKVAAFCCSEAEAGSDVSNIRTRAVYDEKSDTWTINGIKHWITNGGISDVYVVVASIDPELKSRGQASFIVTDGTPGLSAGRHLDKHGFRASHTGEVILDNVVVPGDQLLGGKERLDKRLARARRNESSGEQAAMATFEATRWMVAAMGVGIARAAFEYARDYALVREQFGKPIAAHQQVAELLADMATEIHLARLGVINAAQTYLSTGKLDRAQGSMVKYFASELAVKATRNAMQILGGAGYVNEHPVAQWHADALLLPIFEGTSQIQKNVIASVVTGLRIR